MIKHIATLPGDGIGPEVTAAAVSVLRLVEKLYGHEFNFTGCLIGGAAIEEHGTALPEETLSACLAADAVLMGAVGGPKWDDPNAKVRPEQGLLGLRKGMSVYANLRPVKVHPSLVSASPLRPERLVGVDLMVVRELTGGLYFGLPKGREMVGGHERAVDSLVYFDYEVRRVVDLAFRLAQGRRKKVTSVDKANVLETGRLWRKVAGEVAAQYPDVAFENMLVDTAAMQLTANPARFDVVVTENTFGDILTDEAAVLAGSMGLLPSASLGDSKQGLYEPIHGSAPDIAGKGIANPIGAILSAAMMLRHSFGLEQEAADVEGAVARVIARGLLTPDLGGRQGTVDMAEAVCRELEG